MPITADGRTTLSARAYTAPMSAQPQDFTPAHQLPEKNLGAIRGALVVPQDVEAFDSGLDLVLAEVRATLDTAKLDQFVHTWWLIACDSVKDPKGRVSMYEHVDRMRELAAHGVPRPRSGKTWRELFAARGVEI